MKNVKWNLRPKDRFINAFGEKIIFSAAGGYKLHEVHRFHFSFFVFTF